MNLRALLWLMLVLPWTDAAAKPAPPYPPSDSITGIHFDWSTYRRAAPGSHNWPVT